MLKKKDAKKKETKKQRVDVKDLAPEELEEVSGGLLVQKPRCQELLVKGGSVTVKPIVVY